MSYEEPQGNVTREFDTQREAEAFIEGVEFVNDSALEVLGIAMRDGKFVVEMFDADAIDEDAD